MERIHREALLIRHQAAMAVLKQDPWEDPVALLQTVLLPSEEALALSLKVAYTRLRVHRKRAPQVKMIRGRAGRGIRGGIVTLDQLLAGE